MTDRKATSAIRQAFSLDAATVTCTEIRPNKRGVTRAYATRFGGRDVRIHTTTGDAGGDTDVLASLLREVNDDESTVLPQT